MTTRSTWCLLSALAASLAGCSDDGAVGGAAEGVTGAADGGVSGGGAGGRSQHESGGASTSAGARASAGGLVGDGGAETADAGEDPLADGATPVTLIDGGALPPLLCDGPGARYATSVHDHRFGPGQNYNQDVFPAPVLGPPKGAGLCSGSLDVVSLGNGGTVTLEFAGNGIVDGPGPDFTVFENAFGVQCDVDSPFAELATVAVSDDGVTWREFPCTASAPPFGQCSGWRPVYANPDENDVDPLDPSVSGGDPYDLADVGLARARLVRITDRADLSGTSGVYDLDAVAIVHPACP